MRNKFLALLVATAIPSISYACDICSIYSSVESQSPNAGTWHMSLSEQFTNFGKLRQDGKIVANEAHQHLRSSITQIHSSYDLSDKLAFQFSLPLIDRRYKRLHDGEIDRGTESGLGDMSFIARYSPLRSTGEAQIFNIQIFAGLKLPTGNSDRLKEELIDHGTSEEAAMLEDSDHQHEDSSTTAMNMHAASNTGLLTRHAMGADEMDMGAIHGHDLAIGSGSWDFPVGVNFQLRKDRFIYSGVAQYTFKSEGDHSYRYADDLSWSTGPAYYLLLDHQTTLAVMANLSGEWKKKDTGAEGVSQDDTGTRSIFFGPQLLATINDKINFDLGMDWPLDINNSGLQAVPSYRLKAGLNYKF